jgi:hypothetical protein
MTSLMNSSMLCWLFLNNCFTATWLPRNVPYKTQTLNFKPKQHGNLHDMSLKLCALFHVCLHSNITKFECAYIYIIFIDKAHTHINVIHYINSNFQILNINWSLNLKLKTQICSWRIIKSTYNFKVLCIKFLVLIILVISWEAW